MSRVNTSRHNIEGIILARVGRSPELEHEAKSVRALLAERDVLLSAVRAYACRQNWDGAEWDGLHGPRLLALMALDGIKGDTP